MFFLIKKKYSLKSAPLYADNLFREGYLANMNSTLSENDYNLAVRLLGREPRTPFRIQSRCADGSPQVLLADPVFIEDDIWKPFPAFLWLVCPRLKHLVADLEQQGFVRKYSERLENDADFRERFLDSQTQIASIRLEMAEKIYPGTLPEHIHEILAETTVAGSRDFRGVKCLHSHLAQELAFSNNPIGAEVIGIIGHCSKADNCGSRIKAGRQQ